MARPSILYPYYMVLVGVAGYVALGAMTWERWHQQPAVSLSGAVFFFALSILVGLHPVRLPGRAGATTTVGFAVDFASLLIFGPAVAAWIGVLSDAVLLRRSSWLRLVFNHGMLVLAFAAAGLAYQALGGEYVQIASQVHFGRLPFALVGSGVAYFGSASLLIAIAMALWESRPALGVWAVSFRWMAPRFLALAPFGLLMAMVYQAPGLGLVAVALFLAPLVGARYAFQGAMEMLEVHRETVYALSNALEAYDPYTRNHSEAVTRYALLVGQELGLSEPRLEILEWAGRLHDIGKCRQDWEPIIRKPGKPSEQEWEIIRQHPVEGGRLAERMEFLPHTQGEVARIVRAHHERMDGSGYPDGARGSAISLEARILGVADAFEAMTARRAYRQSRSPEEAVAELRRCSPTQFDPRVVAALEALWSRGELEVEASEQEAAPGLVPTAAAGGRT